MVAAGEADLAILPVSEIFHASGVDFAGTIAREIQLDQVFSGAIVAGSQETKNASRLIQFLASTHASEAIRKSGMEPLAR
jgi:molybdate transport system substrate-binding protein